MDNKKIFQNVLRCLGINSKSELPKPWSEFCPETFPRIVNTNSKEHNIFKESNREKLLSMISVALCLFTDEDSYLVIPLEYQDIKKGGTRHDYAEELMDLIVELSFTNFSRDSMEWVEKINNPDEAIIIFFWVVICSEYYWEDIGLTYKLKLFQFIYDYYKMLFVQLYEDKDCTQDRPKMARECFSSILSCDYYYHELLKPLREIVVAELSQENNKSDEYLRLLKIIKQAHLKKPINSISKENCFFGYNYPSVCLIGSEELSSSETALLSLFNKGLSYRMFSSSNTFSIVDVEADIRRLISYNKLEIYTQRSSKVLCDHLSTVFQDESKIHNDIFKRLSVILRKSTTKSEIEEVMIHYQNISLDHLVDKIYSLWQIGAVHLKTNHNDSIVRCANGEECAVRAEIEAIEKAMRKATFSNEFYDFLKCSEQDNDSKEYMWGKIIFALLWDQKILMSTPYNQEQFTDKLKQAIDILPSIIRNSYKLIIDYLSNYIWDKFYKGTVLPEVYYEIGKYCDFEDDEFFDLSSAIPRAVLCGIIYFLWRKNVVLFSPVQEAFDYESVFMDYMQMDFWGNHPQIIVHALKSKKEKADRTPN